jgi:hypothetical protein
MERGFLAMVLVAAVPLAGCSHETTTTGSTDAGTSAAATAMATPPSATTRASAAPTTGGAAAAAPVKARAVSGPYQATKTTVSVLDSGLKLPGDEDPAGLGAGTLTLQIAPDGRVTGKVSGALGDLTVDGMDRDGELTAQLTPAAGAPINSFTGTLIARDDGTKVTGKMRLSDGINRVLRVADVTLGS